jgi:hypothetical protein
VVALHVVALRSLVEQIRPLMEAQNRPVHRPSVVEAKMKSQVNFLENYEVY